MRWPAAGRPSGRPPTSTRHPGLAGGTARAIGFAACGDGRRMRYPGAPRMSDDDRPATKRDVNGLRGEMAQMGTDLRGEMAQMGTDLRGEMAQMGADLRGEMTAMENRLVFQIADSAQRTLKIGRAHV